MVMGIIRTDTIYKYPRPHAGNAPAHAIHNGHVATPAPTIRE
jgi:hypothetical protein